jgi:hypothetical protein
MNTFNDGSEKQSRSFKSVATHVGVGVCYGLLLFLFTSCLSNTLFASCTYLLDDVSHWPTVVGKVQNVNKLIKTRYRSHQIAAWRVQYSYLVGGHDYQSSRYTYSGVNDGDFDFNPHLAPGHPLKVYFRPSAPSHSVLDNTPPWSDSGGRVVTAFICCILAGIAISLTAPRFRVSA